MIPWLGSEPGFPPDTQALAELPIGAQSLMKGDPVIPTEVTVL